MQIVRVQVNNFTLVDEKEPFEVFALSVQMEYNNFVLYKAIDSFTELNEGVEHLHVTTLVVPAHQLRLCALMDQFLFLLQEKSHSGKCTRYNI